MPSMAEMVEGAVAAAMAAHARPVVRCALDEGASLPERAHATDAGADLRAPARVRVPPRDSALVRTGVHVELPPGTCGLLVGRSGLTVRSALTSTGLIDEGYTGELVVRVFNHGSDWVMLDAGDRFTQLVVLPVLYPAYVEAGEISGGERGGAGFGSTGR